MPMPPIPTKWIGPVSRGNFMACLFRRECALPSSSCHAGLRRWWTPDFAVGAWRKGPLGGDRFDKIGKALDRVGLARAWRRRPSSTGAQARA